MKFRRLVVLLILLLLMPACAPQSRGRGPPRPPPDVTSLAGIPLAFSGGETPGGHPHDERETPGRGAGRQDRRQWTRCIFPTDISAPRRTSPPMLPAPPSGRSPPAR